MAKQLEGVYENVLECAKIEFLKKGFKDASLRSIAQNADTSTGSIYTRFSDKSGLFEALVSPVAEGMLKMISEMEATFYDDLGISAQEGSYRMDNFSIQHFIEYIYDHYDEVKLLITCSEGTVYGDFLNTLVELDVDLFFRYFDWLEKADVSFYRPDRNLIHILINAHYSALFEVVVHDMPKASALLYANTILKFFVSGWNTVLGLE